MRAMVLVAVVTAGMLLPARAGAPVTAGFERPAGTLLFVSGTNRLTSIDVESGRRTSRRAPVASCGPQMQVTGGRLVFAGLRRGRTVVFSVPISLDRRPTRLGAAHAFVPSAAKGRVWLAGTDCSRPALTGVREVTVDGRVTRESDRRLPGEWLVGAVSDGLVLGHRRSLSVWDPATGRSRRLGLEAAAATHGNLLAGCSGRCRDLAILDTATAETVTARGLDSGARFSPDGSLLAVPARRDRRWRIALVDARDGSHAIVAGSRTREYPEAAWSESSGRLFWRAGRRIMAYRPGAPRAQRLPIRPPRQAFAFTAG